MRFFIKINAFAAAAFPYEKTAARLFFNPSKITAISARFPSDFLCLST